jgi:penicillin amidase
MDRGMTRRAALATLLAGGVGGTVAARDILDRFASFSGSIWDTTSRELPGEISSQYGTATLRYDDDGVPHIRAQSEEALHFAVGYAQGADRLFQMDLQRRQMRGELSAIVGGVTLDSDQFHVKMDFAGAAEATWQRFEGTDIQRLLVAYTEGVNRHVAGDAPLPMEYDLLGIDPIPWAPADVLLAEKQIAWDLQGRFRTLRSATVADAFGSDVAATLAPEHMNHGAAILSRAAGGDQPDSETISDNGDGSGGNLSTSTRATDPALVDWLSEFEPPRGVGSNSWVVSGDHTASGAPMLANDPHLSMMAPPIWYEMNLTGPETNVRGVTFPGMPFVVIGENDAGAWGFTNTGADAIDFYEYETREEEYRHGEQWREFETEERTISVAGGENRTVTVRKTVHGPVLSREADGDELKNAVGVAWTGLGASRTAESILRLNRSDGLTEALEAMRLFDLPTQNFVYADRDGNTHYRVVGRIPIRRTDGEAVPGNRVFNGSAREGEWAGYSPYGETNWGGEGFIPFEEMPHIDQPDYLGTANQRILVDPESYPYYFGKPYATPFRGLRLWERLDRRVDSTDSVTSEFMRDLQSDVYDKRAELFVPAMLAARSAVDSDAGRRLLADLDGWDYRMVRDSEGALAFCRFIEHYRDVVFRPRLEAELGSRRNLTEYYGSDWVLIHLDPDSAWFPDGRDAAIAAALKRAAREIEAEGWKTFGDYNQTTIDHPFDREWLNYPRYPTDGGDGTLNRFSKANSTGASWRQVCLLDDSGGSRNAFPGGNDGSPFSEHYADQLEAWANNEYKSHTLTIEGSLAVEFLGDDE